MRAVQRSIISITVANRFGVLTKVATMFSRRGCNIHTFSSGEMEVCGLWRLTVTVLGQEQKVRQICGQLCKLEDVHEAVLLTEQPCLERECALLRLEPGFHPQVVPDGEILVRERAGERGETVLEVLAPAHRIDQLVERLRPHLRACSRTGSAGLSLWSGKDQT